LNEFEGGIVIVTHNVNLISEVCNEIWECGEDQTVKVFPGEFEDYAEKLAEEMKEMEASVAAKYEQKEKTVQEKKK